MMMRRRFACCTGNMRRAVSIDFDEDEQKQQRVMTYNGLESCIMNSSSSRQLYEGESSTSRENGDFFDEDLYSSCSSSTNAFSSFSSSLCAATKKEDQDCAASAPKRFAAIEDETSQLDAMKEKFAKLMLGEDVAGGAKGVCTALALSNAITNLAASVFGELWRLEPLPEERKRRWRREMDWLLSPTHYMVELVPAKQRGSNGRTLEIMTPKARADISVNLPALQKLDSMLIETLDSMVGTEFWYSEDGRSKKPGESRRWWLPSPRVPKAGLSDFSRKQLLNRSKVAYQVFKAARSINESVLAEMQVPTAIKDALPKAGKDSLGEELYKILTSEAFSCADEMMDCLNLKSENAALEATNKLEIAIFAWKEKFTVQSSGKSPVIRTSWTFARDPLQELEKTESLINRAQVLKQKLKSKYPNMSQTFLDATKVKYGKDVGQSILEAYSRVIANLGSSILSRICDVLQEDVISNPNSPAAVSYLIGAKVSGLSDSPMLDRVRHCLIHQLNSVGNHIEKTQNEEEAKISSSSSVNATPSRSRVWCVGKEACRSFSAQSSP